MQQSSIIDISDVIAKLTNVFSDRQKEVLRKEKPTTSRLTYREENMTRERSQTAPPGFSLGSSFLPVPRENFFSQPAERLWTEASFVGLTKRKENS